MAQSSNYKQYNRSTRVLTEESGFAGGMLWTGNNIDETHLKAVVNCDYDETTGYLKTRDPFVVYDDNTPAVKRLQEELKINLLNYRLLCVHNICAFNVDEDDSLMYAGELYIFTTQPQQAGVHNITMSHDNLVCVYGYAGEYYRCDLNIAETVTLRNITNSNILTRYENQLYGIGSDSDNADAWLHVYRVEYSPKTYPDTDGYCFKQLPYNTYVKPKVDSITLLEASVSGFNAARGKDTFTYGAVKTNNPDEQRILGLYIKELVEKKNEDGSTTYVEGAVLVSPPVGRPVKIHVPTVFEEGKTSYLCMFQLNENGETNTATSLEESWTLVGKPVEATNGEFVFDFTFPKKKTTIGFTFYGVTKPATPKAYSDDAVDYLMPYVVTASDNESNLKVKNYNLSDVDGSCIWRNRLCVWGTESSNNCLFFSDVDNFFYYPVPNNVALFDTSVISCIPYKDTLLVFTADKVWRVSEDNSGAFVQTVVQNDMPLSKEDSAHLTAIKNMVLFKSGNYFYMIVPKSQSLTDELTIAPIYKNIAGFLNTLDKSVQEVLQLMYPEYLFTECSVLNNTPATVYSEQDTVHILYDVSATVNVLAEEDGEEKLKSESRSFKLFLNYNTNLRAWTLYLENTTDATLEVATLTNARIMSFVRINNKGCFDIVIQQPVVVEADDFRILLDTGYRTLSTAMQKRFREVQLKLYSVSENVAAFGTSFLVDGVWRRNYSKLQEVLLDNNTISLTPTLDLNTFITELSMPITDTGDILKDPGSDSIELSDWSLDFSHFKREAPVTIRIPVSGKGYNPRFIFMTPNATGLTINEVNWVYRLMHGR